MGEGENDFMDANFKEVLSASVNFTVRSVFNPVLIQKGPDGKIRRINVRECQRNLDEEMSDD